MPLMSLGMKMLFLVTEQSGRTTPISASTPKEAELLGKMFLLCSTRPRNVVVRPECKLDKAYLKLIVDRRLNEWIKWADSVEFPNMPIIQWHFDMHERTLGEIDKLVDYAGS